MHCRWLAARAPLARKATLTGGGWDTADLGWVMAALSQMRGTLVLNRIMNAREAACINAELADSTLTHLVYHGKWPIAAPPSLVSLELSHWPKDLTSINCRLGRLHVTMDSMLSRLQNLPQLQSLTLGSYGWHEHAEHLQRTLGFCPSLRRLHLELIISPVACILFTHSFSFKPLAALALVVQLDLTVHAFQSALDQLVRSFAGYPTSAYENVLQDLQIAHLNLRCLHDTFQEQNVAQLAQCSIQKLTVHLRTLMHACSTLHLVLRWSTACLSLGWQPQQLKQATSGLMAALRSSSSAAG